MKRIISLLRMYSAGKGLNRIIALVLFMTCMTFSALAQSSRGDRLFLEGQNLQQTMTLQSQNDAIKKFQQAKVAYTTDEKKQMCDNQIGICNNNIRRITSQQSQQRRNNSSNTNNSNSGSAETTTQQRQRTERTDAQISFSASRLDYVYNPASGATQSVDVICNYDDWTLDSIPSWVQVFISPDKKSMNIAVIENNDTGEARSCVIIARCDDKYATLTINQEKKNLANGVKNTWNSVFGKKKKKSN